MRYLNIYSVVRHLSVVSVFLLCTSCATMQPRIQINVDSINSGTLEIAKKKYILLPGNKDTSPDDLQFKEYASYINRSLIKQGFVPEKSNDEADIAVVLIYGIGDPQSNQVSYSLPVWGKTGISSSTTLGTANTYGTLSTYDNYGTYSGNTTINSTTTYTPTYGVTGYRQISDTVVTYFRFMQLIAIDLNEYRKSKKEIQLWKTTVTSTGQSGDIRMVFPYLVAASSPYISTNTGKAIPITLRMNDETVMEIKGMIPNENDGAIQNKN